MIHLCRGLTLASTSRSLFYPTQRHFFSLPQLPSIFPGSSSNSSYTKVYHERKILPYEQKQLFDLISDVDSYYRFLPYCIASRVLTQRQPPPNGPNDTSPYEVEAELTVGFLRMEESYVSKVRCWPNYMVQATSSSTPLFKTLETTWRFQPASPQSPHPTANSTLPALPTPIPPSTGPTLLSIDLAYSFESPIHARISDAFFSKVSGMMIDAFERRCLDVYGPGNR